MNILQVIAEMGTGGAEQVVADLADALLADGSRVDVASSGGFRADRLAATGAGIVELRLRERGPVALAVSTQRLRSHLRATPTDVVHSHNVRATLAASLAIRASRRGVPLVTTVHGLDPDEHGRAARILRRTSDRVIAVSEQEAARLVAAGLPRDLVAVIPNASPAPVATTPRDVVRRALGVGADRTVAIAVARLERPKRHDLLLGAWDLVSRDRVDAPLLLVVGDGSRRAEVELAAAPLGDRVRLLGERHDIADLLAACDLAILASDREGMPMVVLEALAAGVPVVASAVGGLLDLPRDTVELVAPGSVEDLARGLDKLLDDPRTRMRRMGLGRQLVTDRYSVSAMFSEYRSVYTAAVDPGRTRRE